MRTRRMNTIIAAAALATATLTGCGDDADTVAEDATVPDEAEETVTEETEQPGVGEEGEGGAAQDELEVGQDVSLTGEVAEVLSPEAFTVGGDEIGENPILVVGANVPADLAEGDTADISGTVVLFTVPGYEEDLDLDLIDQEFEDFDGDPAIQAESVTVQ